ncbi:MAG: hypothetical protein HLUCCO07_01715 [Rhodobacteraceae bacterium HLUCCO07]|nr:MAG: hypothetical protein HLUCCO07_01715 [Rhodobacteraceae bacterium HLUCCO07]
MVGVSQADIARVTGRTDKTVRRAETDVSMVAADTIAAIRTALEDAGVEFIEENGGGPGVRLAKRE